ncbi:MAG: hypothetical protein LE178_02555 [Endomicrobium sp.]|nr:hypothetical protein [Endomicrobium sp.]
MMMLKKRYEYWHCAIALHKLGALMISATHLLTVKDIEYRVKAVDVKLLLRWQTNELQMSLTKSEKICPVWKT